MRVLLGAAISVLVAGLLALGFGIQVKEFEVGKTLILAGTITACTGLIMLGLSLVVRELGVIARRLGPADQAVAARARTGPPPLFPHPQPGEESGEVPPFSRDQAAAETENSENPAAPALPSAPWQEEAARTRQRGTTPSSAPVAAEPAPETKPRRNLLFSSSSRRERERAAARTPDPVATGVNSATPAAPAVAVPVAAPEAGPPATFEDAWPASEPTRSDPYRRGPRRPSTFTDTATREERPPPVPTDDRSQVTVLKSGVVDGMAYSLYSDGSIEAQMPEGMMRFASIGELRAHLDQRS